ncbi:MAG: AAA family ATPase [Acidobacteriota bacterium]
MRIAVSGSHSTGKSTLAAAFVAQCPQYVYEPEAYEMLADDITLTASEGPDVEGLAALLDYTISVLANHRAKPCVLFERSPVDYLAYAAATRSMVSTERADFLQGHLPAVRDALLDLELIVLLPVSDQGPIAARPGEDERFRSRVDDRLRRALIDDEYDLFDGPEAPQVVEFSPLPDQQLAELTRWTEAGGMQHG